MRLNVPPPPPVNQGVPEEMNLATMPWWLKTLLAVGSLAFAYYVMFLRR
jgi:hypothetical protein